MAERKNRTFKDMMKAMLISSCLPCNMGGEVILSACAPNKVPHKKLEKTPYELWKRHAPNLKYLKVWGCLAKVGIADPQRIKVGSKTIDFIFNGYDGNNASYIFTIIQKNRVFSAIC